MDTNYINNLRKLYILCLGHWHRSRLNLTIVTFTSCRLHVNLSRKLNEQTKNHPPFNLPNLLPEIHISQITTLHCLGKLTKVIFFHYFFSQ